MRGLIIVTALFAGIGGGAIEASAQMSERPRVDSGQQGRWWMVVRADDGRMPEAGPYLTQSDCEAMRDATVSNIRRQQNDRMAARLRERSYCERR